jgi:CBS domain-containing protein
MSARQQQLPLSDEARSEPEDPMKVADILRLKGSTVHTVHSWTPVVEAVQRMAGPPPIGALVVCDDGRGHVGGLITERDLIRGLRTIGAAMCEKTVAEFMTRHVPVCAPEDTLTHLMRQMTRSRYRHLPVVQAGVLCGLVSIGDVVRHRLEEVQLEADVLRDMYLAHQ